MVTAANESPNLSSHLQLCLSLTLLHMTSTFSLKIIVREHHFPASPFPMTFIKLKINPGALFPALQSAVRRVQGDCSPLILSSFKEPISSCLRVFAQAVPSAYYPSPPLSRQPPSYYHLVLSLNVSSSEGSCRAPKSKEGSQSLSMASLYFNCFF